jgi:hypothetical protein
MSSKTQAAPCGGIKPRKKSKMLQREGHEGLYVYSNKQEDAKVSGWVWRRP